MVGGWLEPLNRALYPPAGAAPPGDARRTARRSSRRTACSSGQDNDRDAVDVVPGLHAFADGYDVVWWDPGALSLGAKPRSACGAKS